MIYIKCISKHQQNNITTFKNKSAITHCSAAKRWIHLRLRLIKLHLLIHVYIFILFFLLIYFIHLRKKMYST